MFQLVKFCLLVIILQGIVITAEPIPMHCWVPPPEVTNPEKCCKLPKIFQEEDFEDCGLDISVGYNMFKPRDCSQDICLLKKYNAIKEYEIEKNTTLSLLDAVAETYNDFQVAVEEAKEICVENELPELPNREQVCKPTAMISCIAGILIMNCPNWEESANCDIMKRHVVECRDFVFD